MNPMTRIYKTLLFIALASLAFGCGTYVRYDLSERFSAFRPYTIAVLPAVFAEGVKEDAEAAGLLRKMAAEKLLARGYRVIPIKEVDEYLEKESAQLKGKGPGEAAALLNADAALVIEITGWESRLFVTYASIRLDSSFELRASRASELLWKASYSMKESDARLDRASVELSVIKAYEPMFERFTDAVMRTLPQAEPRAKERRFFEWLP